jgi:hypothetical protein
MFFGRSPPLLEIAILLVGELPMPLARHHKGMKIVAATDAFFVGEGLLPSSPECGGGGIRRMPEGVKHAQVRQMKAARSCRNCPKIVSLLSSQPYVV